MMAGMHPARTIRFRLSAKRVTVQARNGTRRHKQGMTMTTARVKTICCIVGSVGAGVAAAMAHIVYPNLHFLPPMFGWIAGAMWMTANPLQQS